MMRTFSDSSWVVEVVVLGEENLVSNFLCCCCCSKSVDLDRCCCLTKDDEDDEENGVKGCLKISAEALRCFLTVQPLAGGRTRTAPGISSGFNVISEVEAAELSPVWQ